MNVLDDLAANPEPPSQLLEDSEHLIGRGDTNTYCSIILRRRLARYMILFRKVFLQLMLTLGPDLPETNGEIGSSPGGISIILRDYSRSIARSKSNPPVSPSHFVSKGACQLNFPVPCYRVICGPFDFRMVYGFAPWPLPIDRLPNPLAGNVFFVLVLFSLWSGAEKIWECGDFVFFRFPRFWAFPCVFPIVSHSPIYFTFVTLCTSLLT
jgi:hypothetical protein